MIRPATQERRRRAAGLSAVVVFFVAHFAWLPIAVLSGDAMWVAAGSKCGSRLCACTMTTAAPKCPLCDADTAPGSAPGSDERSPCPGHQRLAMFGEVPEEAGFAGLPLVIAPLTHVAGPAIAIVEPAATGRAICTPRVIPASPARDVAVPPPRRAA